MLLKFRNWCIGKSLSYWDNAIEDAEVSDNIIRSVVDRVRYPIDPRSSKFCRGTKIDKIIYAYTLYYINGYMDYVAAKLFGYLGGVSYKLITKHYRDAKIINIFDWARPLWGDYRRIEAFITTTDLEVQLVQDDVLKNIKYVQEVNINRNTKTIKIIRQSIADLKNRYKLYDRKYNLDKITSSYISTQYRAIYWDKLYIRIIDQSLKARTS